MLGTKEQMKRPVFLHNYVSKVSDQRVTFIIFCDSGLDHTKTMSVFIPLLRCSYNFSNQNSFSNKRMTNIFVWFIQKLSLMYQVNRSVLLRQEVFPTLVKVIHVEQKIMWDWKTFWRDYCKTKCPFKI